MSVFDKVVLPTHASCHVQYYMFYLCSFRLVRSHFSFIHKQTIQRRKKNIHIKNLFIFPQGLAEAFLDHLWKLLQGPNQPPILRQAAAGYMGSFMARAKFLPVSYVTLSCSLSYLIHWSSIFNHFSWQWFVTSIR